MRLVVVARRVSESATRLSFILLYHITQRQYSRYRLGIYSYLNAVCISEKLYEQTCFKSTIFSTLHFYTITSVRSTTVIAIPLFGFDSIVYVYGSMLHSRCFMSSAVRHALLTQKLWLSNKALRSRV